MLIGVMQNLPELVGGIAVIILTVIVDRTIILWPVLGSKKIKQRLGLK